MRKLLHLDSPTERYHCDAAVIACFDNRFETATRKLLKRLGIERPDLIRIAGGPKALASPERDFERDFVIAHVRKSINLHGTTRALLVLHSDCGAYGGRFPSRDSEIAGYEDEFRKAAAALSEPFPGLAVDCYYLDFEGVWEPCLSR